MEAIQKLNEKVFWYFYNFAHQSSGVDSSIIFTAETLGVILLIILVVFLFSHEHIKAGSFSSMTGRGVGRGFHNVIVILVSAALAWVISRLIKMGFAIDRPFIALDEATPLFQPSDSSSFPSGHATFFSAVATALYFYHKKLGVLALLGAVAIGFARIMAGVHWPLDIIAGITLGILSSIAFFKIYKKISTKLHHKGTPIFIPTGHR